MPRFTHPYEFFASRTSHVATVSRGVDADGTPDRDGPPSIGAVTDLSTLFSEPLRGDFVYGNDGELGAAGRLFIGDPSFRYWEFARIGAGDLTLPPMTDFWFELGAWRGAVPQRSTFFESRAVTVEIGVTWESDRRFYPFHVMRGSSLNVFNQFGPDDGWHVGNGVSQPVDQFSPGALFTDITWRVSAPPTAGVRVWVAPLESDSSFTLGVGVGGTLAESRIVRTRAAAEVELGGFAVDTDGRLWDVEAITAVGRGRLIDVTLSRGGRTA